MLTSLEVENFKAFGRRTRLPLRPITLIFGENSAGKSSILQALNLLKQTRESREAGALLLPRSEREIVDLGSFQEMLFDHDLKRTLSFRLQSRFSGRHSPALRRAAFRGNVQSSGVEFSFDRPSMEKEVRLRTCTFFVDDMKIATFHTTEDIPDQLRRRSRHLFRRRQTRPADLSAAECTWITDEEIFWSPYYERTLQSKDKLLQLLHDMLDEAESEGKNGEPLDMFDYDEDAPSTIQAVRDTIDFYRGEFGLPAFIDRMRRTLRNAYISLDGFMPVAGYIDARSSPEYDLRWSRSFPMGFTLDIGWLVHSIGRELEATLESLFPLGPFRTPPARWYIFTGTSPQDVGYEGELLPDLLYRRPKVLNHTNEWLERLNIGYQLQVVSAGARLRDLFEVRLKDTRREKPVDVSLSDVGFGISQILPFVVQSLAAEEQIISIEQPEVHVHPRLQADLGDLLAEAIKPPRGNQFIIETHSEHLVLRLQRLIREGVLQPDDVSVIYVSRGPDGSIAERLRLDEDGDFIDEWPGGFFPERLRELL